MDKPLIDSGNIIINIKMLSTSSSLLRHNQTFLKTLFQSASAGQYRSFSVAFNVKSKFEEAYKKKSATQTVKKE